MSWVKLSLTRGEAQGREWQVDATAAGARVEVGSDPMCSWPVNAPGVSAKHLEVYWDGEVLWVARIHGADEVKVDGLLVDDWYAMAKGSTIQFGAAELRVDLGTGALDTSGVASRVTEQVNSPDGHPEAKTTLAAPGSIGRSPSAPGVPTAPVEAPPAHISAAATQIVSQPPMGTEDAAGRIAAFEAQVTGGGAAPGPMPNAQATQLVAMPDVPGSPPSTGGGARRPPPPRIGQNVSSVQRATPTPVPPAPANAGPPPAVPGPAPAPSATPGVDESTEVLGSTPFAAPPAFDPKAKKKRRKKAKGEKSGSLPARTWVLLVATVGALVFVLFMDDEEVPDAPPAPGETAAADGAAGTDPAATDAAAPPAAADTSLAALPVPVPPSGDNGASAEGESEGEGEGEGETSPLVRQAVDALVANRQREAYDLYGQLVTRYPDEPAYAALRDILRRRLQASCRDGVDPQGNPCTEVE